MDDKKRPNWLLLLVRPTGVTMGTCEVRYYLDYATTPTGVDSLVSDSWPSGITIVPGDTKITVDLDVGALDGFVPVPCIGQFSRAVRAEIKQLSPYGGVRFVDAQFAADTKLAEAPQHQE